MSGITVSTESISYGRRRTSFAEQHPEDAAEARLASYKVPKSFEIIDRIPRSTAGKGSRSELVDERA